MTEQEVIELFANDTGEIEVPLTPSTPKIATPATPIVDRTPLITSNDDVITDPVPADKAKKDKKEKKLKKKKVIVSK